MKFSRRATNEDFDYEKDRWKNILPIDIRDEMMNRKDRYRGVIMYRNLTHCGIEEAKSVLSEYIKFLNAFDDFQDGKDVYIEY